MSTVLVTGGAGFIGSHIVEKLIQNNHEVIVLDNLSCGKKSQVHPDARFYHASIQDPSIEELFSLHKIDYIVHMAAAISVQGSVDDPVQNASTNVLGSLKLLELAKKYGVKKFVFPSSAAVYSPEVALPTKEDDMTHPLSPYGITKLTLEKYLAYYLKQYGIPYVIFRFANVYGPRQSVNGETGVISLFLKQLLSNAPVTIHSDGHQTRDFIYVEDVADAVVAAMVSEVSGIYNIATGKETSINQLHELLKDITDVRIDPIRKPDGFGHELRRSVLDFARARQHLGFSPKISIHDGLRRTHDWYKKEFSDNNVWIVIAAYNEEKKIGSVLQNLKRFAKNIIVVNDCSKDATSQVARNEGVIVLDHLVNRGQGAALQTGMSYALEQGAEVIVNFDADGQHQAHEIARIIQPIIDNEADMALGSRFLGTALNMSFARKMVLKGGILFTRFISRIKLTDVHNGFRAYSRKAAQTIYITQDRMAHASEILDQIARKKIKYVEVPVTITYSDYSKVKGQSSLNAINIAAKIVYSKLISK